MRIYDISQEVFGCEVYPDDPRPSREIIYDMNDGHLYNLTAFSMCAHNGTHVDAPKHFLKDGGSVYDIPLEKTVGKAYVAEHNGIVTAEDARAIINKAEDADVDSAKKILLKGNCTVSLEAAEYFAARKIDLIGNESQTVGPEDAPMSVHIALLEADVVILEGIRLASVSEGVYFLNAAPLPLEGADGAPCRAILIEAGGAVYE